LRGPRQRPDLNPVRGPYRRLLRTPERDGEQGLVRRRKQHPKQMPFRTTGRDPERRPLPMPEREHGWPLHLAPYRWLLRVPERGPDKGQESPPPSRG